VGVLRVVLSAVRGAGAVGVAAAERIGADPPSPRAPRSRAGPTPAPGADDVAALGPFFPSQSESAAMLDTYLGGSLASARRRTSY
jgi:hypothetical protein